MPFAAAIPLIAAGASGLFGMLNNRNRQNQQQTSSTTPTMNPAFGPLQQMLINHAMQRLEQPGGLPAGYEANGINTINKTYDLASQGLNNDLTSRGLGSSPVAGSAMSRMTAGRAGDIGRFRTDLPNVARDRQNQDFGMITNLLNMGRGSSSTGTGQQTQEGGGGAAGGATNLMQMLGYLMGSGAFGGGGQPGGPGFGIGAANTGSWSMRP